MLQLKNIHKIYETSGEKVHALKGIDLCFRDSEFVAILGPSGCGKTTLLNLIGGLDSYTDGDLVINGRSTKDYRARDWDMYRNHSIGFVFQSYNLIPHQTVLQNVELALTLSGVSRAKRRKLATEALKSVGLESQLKKKPSEMSGGQMQRVAIARALVNDPDIILADEPTGALDTQTSIQVMDILKEVAKNKLVIMVTHNPDLADTYATRTIRMLDGEITGDSDPLSEEEPAKSRSDDLGKVQNAKRQKKPSMSAWTSFGLSLKNLFTKKGRTTLTSFAGSIGIIGIALIYAVSNGMTTYINKVQEETLSTYPLSLESQHIDLGSLMQTFMDAAESDAEHEKDAVYPKKMVFELLSSLNDLEAKENDLEAFQTWLDRERNDPNAESDLYDSVSGVQYVYPLNLTVYTKNVDDNLIKSDAQELMRQLVAKYYGIDDVDTASSSSRFSSSSSGSPMASLMSSGSANRVTLWQEMLAGTRGEVINNVFEKQYDVIYGTWPNSYDEIVLVLDENNEISDIVLYALGLESEDDMQALIDSAMNGEEIKTGKSSFTYEEICGREYRVILDTDCYEKDPATGLFTDLRDSDAGLSFLYQNKGISLRVTGIIRPKAGTVSTILTGNIGYTHLLTDELRKRAENSEAILEQLEKPETDLLNGLPFRSLPDDASVTEKADAFRTFLSGATDPEKAEYYRSIHSIPDDAMLESQLDAQFGSLTREQLEEMVLQSMAASAAVSEDVIRSYLAEMSDEELLSSIREAAKEKMVEQYRAAVSAQFAEIPEETLVMMLDKESPDYSDDACAEYYEKVLRFSDSDLDKNLVKFGKTDADIPIEIQLYANTFEHKDQIKDAIQAYNDQADDAHQIEYTDYVGIIMSSVTTIIDAITYVLIAFVAISLIVSSIMIGVITLISVQERTKEIGILRSLGASKRNVASLFNAETLIIGFFAGAVGVLLTYLLCVPINLILHKLTGIETLSAILPINVALILIAISMFLTLIAGIIPSRSASKKDPVVALRTE